MCLMNLMIKTPVGRFVQKVLRVSRMLWGVKKKHTKKKNAVVMQPTFLLGHLHAFYFLPLTA